MPLPRPPGSGVEKILISSHQISEDHVLYFIVFTRRSSEPRVGFLASCLWLLFLLCCSPPCLSLTPFGAPLSFSPGCPTIPGEVSHLITIITLHLRCVPMPFSLRSMVSVPWWKGGFLILLVSGRRFVVSHRKSSLRPRSCRRVHRVCIGYGWMRRGKESPQVVWFSSTGAKPFQYVSSLFDRLHVEPFFLPFDGCASPSFIRLWVVELVYRFI